MKRLKQKDFHYTISPFREPVLNISPGEVVIIDLIDALGGKKDEIPSRFNPCAGPIYVEGAEKGDALAIDVNDIKLTEESGISFIWNETDALTSILLTPRMEPVITPVKDGKVYFQNVTLPIRPNIGCIGTAPEDEAIATDYPGKHGGNIDTPDVCVGNRLFLPINVPGAHLYAGDVHAISGAGELNCVDISAEITLTVNLVKNKRINWPRIESPEYIETVSTGAPIKESIRNCYKELVLWLEEEYKLDRWDAYLLCTEVASIQVPKIVAPAPTVTVKFPKKYLSSATSS